MWDWLTIIYVVYAFIALYFLFLYLMIYMRNRKQFNSFPEITKNYSLTMIVPCFNAQDHIKESIETLFKSDYGGLKKVIVVDDCSKDNSYNIAKGLEKKYGKRLLVVKTPKNTGCAAGSKNYGLKFADTFLVGFADDDSYAQSDAIRKMIGYFDDKKVAAVTSAILVKNRKKLIEKLQSIEYKIIVFTRTLLGFVDAIYVTPGPLAIYRKSALLKIGGFDEKNLTEDIEITWRFAYHGYRVAMSISSRTHTVAPDTWKAWYRQRLRWNIGGLQTINKYKKTFLRKGMLGKFILPFFVLNWAIGILGVTILSYRVFRRVVISFLTTKYSIGAQTTVLSLREINMSPNTLIFFGTAILIFSLLFTLVALTYTREKDYKTPGPIDVLVYTFIYLLAYPFILINALYRYLIGKKSW